VDVEKSISSLDPNNAPVIFGEEISRSPDTMESTSFLQLHTALFLNFVVLA
jgi:hypothetical protein